ncbi:RES family NAD+ phosphorylase [soil metagenome]
MIVYRITTVKWAGQLSGSGQAGRWNSKGNFVIYTASTRALACLENLVHRSGEGLNHNFKITEIRIPDDCTAKTISTDDLPSLWFKMENTVHCRRIGDNWIEQKKNLLLHVPSSIIPDELNVLINPAHTEFEKISVHAIRDFSFDERLKMI